MEEAEILDEEIKILHKISIAAQNSKMRKKARKKVIRLEDKNTDIKIEASNQFEKSHKIKYEAYNKRFDLAKERFIGSEKQKINGQQLLASLGFR